MFKMSGVFIAVSSDMEYDRHRAKLMLVLEYAMLAGMIGGVEVAPRLLRLLLVQLKEITMQFRPIVSDPFYLPYPPVYCPQPTLSSKVRLASVVIKLLTCCIFYYYESVM